jgi:hypothetical protein
VNTATKITELPALTADLLQSNIGGTSNIVPFRRPFFFLIQLVVVLI